MEKPKLHWMVYSIIHHNIMDRMCGMHKAVDINITLELSIHVERWLCSGVNRCKQSCLIPLTGMINE